MGSRSLPSLSKRQLDVLQGLSEGLTAKEVGKRLSIEESSVRTHIRYILRKSGFRNVTEAASEYRSAGMVAGPVGDDYTLDQLSIQEREVLPLLRKGLTNKAISDSLLVTENIVNSRIDSILWKWNIHTRTGIACIATILEQKA